MKKQPSPVVQLIAETQYKSDGHKEKLAGAEPWLRNKYLKDAKKIAKALDAAGVLPAVSRETPVGSIVPTDLLGLAPGSPYQPSLLYSRLSQPR